MINHFIHCRKPTFTFQRRKSSIFLKNKSFVSLSIFINHLYIVYMFMKFLYLYLLLPFVLLVLPFLVYISKANISKPILATASTVSVISDVTMQSINVTSVPVYFFTNRQPFYVAQLMCVNCVYIVMMFVILLHPHVSQ